MKTLHVRQIAGFVAFSGMLCTLEPTLSRAGPDLVNPPREIVQFADLDLSKTGDVERLYRRIKIAARSVCNEAISMFDSRASAHFATCYEATVNDVISHVNHPGLTALHIEKTAKPVRSAANSGQ
jgi:UrcA family protein